MKKHTLRKLQSILFSFKTYLRLIACLLVVTTLISSCKKNDKSIDQDNGSNFIEATIGGKKMQFNGLISGQISDDKTHIVVGGSLNDDLTSDRYDFEIFNAPNEVVAGNYAIPGTRNMISRFSHQNVISGKIAGTTIFNASSGSDGSTNNSATFILEITSIDSKRVSGKFKGHLKLLGGSDFVEVTDGRFSVPFHKG